MKSIFTGLFFIFLFILVFTSLSLIGNEIDNNNLDSKSQAILLSIDDTLGNDLNITNIEEKKSNNTNSEDKASFGFEFLRASNEAEKKISLINVVKDSPQIIISSTGANSADFSPFTNIFKWFLGILISLIAFDAIFTRRVF